MRMKILRGYLIAALTLSGCGGSDAGISTPPTRPPPSPPPAAVSKAEGIWSGTTLVGCDPYPVLGLVTRDNNLFIYTPVGIYVGSITGGTIKVTAVRYNRAEGVPFAWSANPGAKPLKITKLQEKARLGIEWEPAPPNFCTQGNSVLGYFTSLYERPSSLALIAGVYTDGLLTIAVNSDGVVTGSDMDGCVLNGNVGVVHPDRNYYSVVVDVANCAASGNYEGAAFLGDGQGWKINVLQIVAANPDYAIWRRLTK